MICGIFRDLEKAFDTVRHDILLKKLDHCGIRGISNDWFRTCLSDQSQFVFINDFNSDYKTIKYSAPQGSVLGPLLFLIFINDLNKAIKNSETFHFADDTCLLNIKDSVKQINKVVKKDFKFLVHWLNANRTLLAFFGPPHINHLSQKLVRANVMLCKLWHLVNVATLKSIYYAIFHSLLLYVFTASGQNLNSKHRINLLPKKAMQIISFASFDAHTLPIFAKLNIIKFPDLISFCNCLFVYKHFLSKFPSVFSNVFILTFNTHEENTRSALHGLLTQPSCSTSKYGINAFCCFSYKIMELFFKKVF